MKNRRVAGQLRPPLCAVLALAAGGAWAQLTPGGSLGQGGGAGSFDTAATPGRQAGGLGAGAAGSGGRAFYMTPTLTANATLTDNVNLSATDKQSDLILQISPGIQIGGQSGRIRGYLNYALTASFHANNSDSSTFYNNLSAQVNAEVVPDRLFVDASANISQQFLSPFGTQSSDSSLNNSNRTEVSTINVAPYFKGQLAGQVDYLGRAFYIYTNSGSSQAADSAAWGGLLAFNSTTRWPKLSWGLDLSYREIDFSDSRREFDQLNVLSLNYAVTPELRVSLRGNTERSNLTSIDAETTSGYGGGLRWNPSPRTNLFLEYDQRIFGSSHLYTFDYRTPRTVWSISSRQGLSTGQNFGGPSGGRQGSGTAFDLLFAQLATVQPDPVLRAQLVNNFLRANNIDPNAALNTGFLPSQVVEELRQEASVAWLGLRSTVIFNVYQTQSKSLQPALLNPDDDFSGGNVIRWVGFSANWAHRLNPRSTLTLTLNQQRTSETVGTQESTFRTAYAMWSNQIFRRATLSLTARHQRQSGSSPYTESALLANLSMQF